MIPFIVGCAFGAVLMFIGLTAFLHLAFRGLLPEWFK